MTPRSQILWGAAAPLVGIATALVVDPTLGGVMVIVGVAVALMGLHRLGRSGPGTGG